MISLDISVSRPWPWELCDIIGHHWWPND